MLPCVIHNFFSSTFESSAVIFSRESVAENFDQLSAVIGVLQIMARNRMATPAIKIDSITFGRIGKSAAQGASFCSFSMRSMNDPPDNSPNVNYADGTGIWR